MRLPEIVALQIKNQIRTEFNRYREMRKEFATYHMDEDALQRRLIFKS